MNEKKKVENCLLPTNDYVFARIFGKIGNEKITKGLLSSIISDKIETIKLSGSKILERDLINDKMGILDIRANVNDETEVDIEMQLVNKQNIEKRLLYYWSLMYSKGIKKGEDFKKLKRTIVILFANFDFKELKDIQRFHTEWAIREKNSPEHVLTNVLEFHIISLMKALEIMDNEDFENKKLKAWVHFLTDPKNMREDELMENEEIQLAQKELKQIEQNEHEERLAMLRQKYVLDMNAIKDFGLEEGQKQKQLEIAKNMLKDKVSIELICKYTGLTKEEIENEMIDK
jgi:predicted transposase/invertase (TIGR01784 family)